MSVTHIAGWPICISGRLIQRCALCGDKLIDTKGSNVPLDENGNVGPVSGAFGVNKLVTVCVDGNTKHTYLSEEQNFLPDDSCLPLVEE